MIFSFWFRLWYFVCTIEDSNLREMYLFNHTPTQVWADFCEVKKIASEGKREEKNRLRSHSNAELTTGVAMTNKRGSHPIFLVKFMGKDIDFLFYNWGRTPLSCLKNTSHDFRRRKCWRSILVPPLIPTRVESTCTSVQRSQLVITTKQTFHKRSSCNNDG